MSAGYQEMMVSKSRRRDQMILRLFFTQAVPQGDPRLYVTNVEKSTAGRFTDNLLQVPLTHRNLTRTMSASLNIFVSWIVEETEQCRKYSNDLQIDIARSDFVGDASFPCPWTARGFPSPPFFRRICHSAVALLSLGILERLHHLQS